MAQASSSLANLLGLIGSNSEASDYYYSNTKNLVNPDSLASLKTKLLADPSASSNPNYATHVNKTLDPSRMDYEQMKVDYDQYLQGQKMGNDPANQRPLYSSATNQWYDYAGSKWRDIGDGWGTAKVAEEATSGGVADPSKPRSRPGYSYGSDNPYLMEMLGLQKPAAGSKYTPQGKKIKGKSQSTMDITDMLAKGGVYGNY